MFGTTSCVCVCVRACVRACVGWVFMCMRVCLCAHARELNAERLACSPSRARNQFRLLGHFATKEVSQKRPTSRDLLSTKLTARHPPSHRFGCSISRRNAPSAIKVSVFRLRPFAHMKKSQHRRYLSLVAQPSCERHTARPCTTHPDVHPRTQQD